MNNDEKIGRDLVKSIFRCELVERFERGEITEQDLKLDAHIVFKKVFKPFLNRRKDKDVDVKVWAIIDHRSSILRDAKNAQKKGNSTNALIFYAIYFEHEINHLVDVLAARRSLSDNSKRAIMRLPLHDKMTWLLEIFQIKPPNSGFLKFLKPFSEERNSYMHYKWSGSDLDAEDPAKIMLRDVGNHLRYFRSYVSRVIYNGRKAEITKKIEDIVSY